MSTKPRIPLLIGACLLIAVFVYASFPGHSVKADNAFLNRNNSVLNAGTSYFAFLPLIQKAPDIQPPTATPVVTHVPTNPATTATIIPNEPAATATRVPTRPAATATRIPTRPAATATTAPTRPVPTATTAPAGPAYYVSTSGNDGNAGTINSPWRTISKGVSMLQPGYTLYVRGGTYYERMTIDRSGASSTKPITVAAYPGETPVLEGGGGSGAGDYSNWVSINGSYVTLDGFEVRKTPGNGVAIGSSSVGAVVRNLNVHHTMNCGVVFSGSYSLMETSRVWQASLNASPSYQNHSAYWCAGTTSTLGAHDVTIRRSQIYNSWGEGLDVLRADRFTVEDNLLYDNWALNLYMDNATNVTAQRNLIYYTNDHTWWRWADNPATNITIADEPYSAGQNLGHDRKIINNIVIGGSTNLRYFAGGANGSALVNDVIANNTFVEAAGSWACAIALDAPTGASHRNTVFRNNIILQSSGMVASIPNMNGISLSNNIWSRDPGGQYHGAGDIFSNPLLAAPGNNRVAGNVSPDWYKLQSGSPAIGKAMPLSQVTDDYFHQSRSAQPSIGAHEYR